MELEILSPEKKIFAGEVTSVQLPGSEGGFQVLNNHAPVLSTLKKGTIRIKSSQGNQTFEVKGGVVEVLKNKIIVLAE